MSTREHEQLDVYEMEHMVAQALIELVDAPGEQRGISARTLSARTKLPLHRVREVTDDWNLQTISGDTFWLGPESLERARKVLSDGPDRT
jgi:hypothetical protein